MQPRPSTLKVKPDTQLAGLTPERLTSYCSARCRDPGVRTVVSEHQICVHVQIQYKTTTRLSTYVYSIAYRA